MREKEGKQFGFTGRPNLVDLRTRTPEGTCRADLVGRYFNVFFLCQLPQPRRPRTFCYRQEWVLIHFQRCQSTSPVMSIVRVRVRSKGPSSPETSADPSMSRLRCAARGTGSMTGLAPQYFGQCISAIQGCGQRYRRDDRPVSLVGRHLRSVTLR